MDKETETRKALEDSCTQMSNSQLWPMPDNPLGRWGPPYILFVTHLQTYRLSKAVKRHLLGCYPLSHPFIPMHHLESTQA